MRQARFSLRVARVVFTVLFLGICAQLVTVGAVFYQRDLLIREWVLGIGLRLVRTSAEGGALTDERLSAEFGDFSGFTIVLYDRDGHAIARSSGDIPVIEQLSPKILRAAQNDRPVFPGLPILGLEHTAILRMRGARAEAGSGPPHPVAYVGMFDRWAAHRILFGIAWALGAGFVASCAVWVGATLILGRRLRKGLRHAEDAVHHMASGSLDIRLPSYGHDEIGRLASDFNRMADNLAEHIEHLRRERDLRRRSFAAWTHEIATPLTSVIGYLESLCMGEEVDIETRERYVGTAYERAMALKGLTDDLRTMSQIDFDGLRIESRRLDLAEIAKTEVAAFVHEAETRGVALRSEHHGPAPALGDGQRLAQVVRNLVSNALRHSPEGSHVVVRVRSDDATRLEVRDHGSGIPAEHLAHLGELFYRVDTSRDRKTGGRGLGLAIARGIVEAHGGKLHISSELGAGTIATVELPLLALEISTPVT
ncbi:MAG TPA: HAMP domain-containing sensor histidine kinase [Polyangiaceae bacterium]|nr:HAMP domain-containing sensor histidine kinase [Polyangiaceae bacterium]